MNKPLYKKGDIVEILPPEDCDTSYGPGYTFNMIEVFSKNPKVEILFNEIRTVAYNGEVIDYYQYKVRDCHGDGRYVNEDWIRPRSTTALFV